MNIMIYINRDVEPKFKSEVNKSGLVNQLLDAHYRNVPMDILKQGKGGRYNGDTPLVGKEIPKDIEKVKEDVAKIKPLVKLLGECPRHHIDRSVCKCT